VEDWLNESFAEYSALMAVRELFGTGRFQNIIAGKRKRSEGMPPIKALKGMTRELSPFYMTRMLSALRARANG